MNLSPGPMGSSAGMQSPITSTPARVAVTRLLSRSPSSVRGLWIPGVSTRMSWPFFWCTIPRIARRVVCGFDDVIATFSPTRALVSVDLPTLGRPTNDTNPARYASARSSLVLVIATRSFIVRHSKECRLRIDQCFVSFHQHCAAALAPALDSFRGQAQPADPGCRTDKRKTTQRLGKKPADRVDIVVVEFEVKQFSQFIDRQPCTDSKVPVAEILHIDRLPVIFV